MTAANPPILEAKDIDFSYGRLQVLFGVSITVQPGEAVALLGTNGAGKSTLLRVMAGLERPTAGHVTLCGEDITGLAAERLTNRGLVLIVGGKSVFSELTVSENLEIQGLAVRKRGSRAKERRDHVFELFPRLAERRSQLAGQLSGGEQQQLALARAVLIEPAVLCLDELSLGLAPVVVQDLMELVQKLKETGITLVVVEQSLNIAAALCPRAVFMEKGSIQFEGASADLLERDDIARAVFLGGAASDGVTAERRGSAASRVSERS